MVQAYINTKSQSHVTTSASHWYWTDSPRKIVTEVSQRYCQICLCQNFKTMQCEWCNNYVISLKLQSILDGSKRDPRNEPHEDPALYLETRGEHIKSQKHATPPERPSFPDNLIESANCGLLPTGTFPLRLLLPTLRLHHNDYRTFQLQTFTIMFCSE